MAEKSDMLVDHRIARQLDSLIVEGLDDYCSRCDSWRTLQIE